MTNQVIPEAAVEAAACWIPHSDTCEVRPERDCTCWQSRVNLMRAALEAAAPHMLGEAWDEGSIAGWVESGLPHSWHAENSLRNSNPYRTAK